MTSLELVVPTKSTAGLFLDGVSDGGWVRGDFARDGGLVGCLPSGGPVEGERADARAQQEYADATGADLHDTSLRMRCLALLAEVPREDVPEVMTILEKAVDCYRSKARLLADGVPIDEIPELRCGLVLAPCVWKHAGIEADGFWD